MTFSASRAIITGYSSGIGDLFITEPTHANVNGFPALQIS